MKKENIKIYLQPAFLICIAVLAAAGAGMSLAINNLGMFLQKEPVFLKKPLDVLEEENLSPYTIEPYNKHKIENLEILESLGTEQYILWDMTDTSVQPGSPTSELSLFITYYPMADNVPHVPEECYTGSGYRRVASESVTLSIDNNADFKRQITAKYLVFGDENAMPGAGPDTFPVVYFFRVNDRYTSGREQTRIALNSSILNKSSYFSKVELAFNISGQTPDKEETIEACNRLLAVILPVLEQQHWPGIER